MAAFAADRQTRTMTTLPDIFRTINGLDLDIGPTDRLTNSTALGDRSTKLMPTNFPRIVLRDLAGNELDTFTTLQEAIYRAKWNVKQYGFAKTPQEWRLPKAPAPARPDLTRVAPGLKPVPRPPDRRVAAPRTLPFNTLEFDVEDVGFVKESLQHLPNVPSLSFLRQEFLVGPKTYFQIVGTVLLHERVRSETEKRDAPYSFPGFCSGCKRLGFCYGCARSQQAHYHEDRPMRTGGGFMYLQKDKPEHQIKSKNPANWKIRHQDAMLRKLIHEFSGDLEGPITDEINKELERYSGSDDRANAASQIPDFAKEFDDYKKQQEDAAAERAERIKQALAQQAREQSTNDDDNNLDNDQRCHDNRPGSDPGEIDIEIHDTGYDDDGYQGQSEDADDAEGKEKYQHHLKVPSGLMEEPYNFQLDNEEAQRGYDKYGHRLPKFRKSVSEDGREGGMETEKQEESKKEKLYKAPPPFKLKKSGGRRIEAKSPFSTDRVYNLPTGKGLDIKKSDKATTECVGFEKQEGGWKAPDKFELKKSEAKKTKFWTPPPPKPKEVPPKPYPVPKRVASPKPVSPDSGLDSDFITDSSKSEVVPVKEPTPPPPKMEAPPTITPTAQRLATPACLVDVERPESASNVNTTDSESDTVDTTHSTLPILPVMVRSERQINLGDLIHTEPPPPIEQNVQIEALRHPSSLDTNTDKFLRPSVANTSLHGGGDASSLRHSAIASPATQLKDTDTNKHDCTKHSRNTSLLAAGIADHIDSKEKPEPPKRRELVKKVRKIIPPPPKPPTPPTPVIPRTPTPPPPVEEPPSREASIVLSEPSETELPPVEIPELPEYQEKEYEHKAKKKKERKLIEVAPELPEALKKLRAPPKLAPRIKMKEHRKKKVAEAPVTTEELQALSDPLDFLAKYCIINPDRLPYYERVFTTVLSIQMPRYSRDSDGMERGNIVTLPPAQLSQHELNMLRDLTVLTHAQTPRREGLSAPEQYQEKLNYSMELIQKKQEKISAVMHQLQKEKMNYIATMAKKWDPEIGRLDYKSKSKNKKEKPGKKKKKHAVDYDVLGAMADFSNFHPRRAADITDEVIVSRMDDKMRKKVSKEAAVKSINIEINRNIEKLKHTNERLLQIDDEKDLVGLYCMDSYFSEQANRAHPLQFRRQQSRLYQKLHPDPDAQMNIEEVEAALQTINNKLMTQKEFQYIYLIMNLPKREKISFRLFSIIAALSEKVTQMDPVIRKLINKQDYDALDIKMEKSKELFALLEDSDDFPHGNAAVDNLAVELTAGGLTPEHTNYVLSKFNREGKGFIDFLDFVTYVPLFLEIHKRIINDPFNDDLVI